MNKLAEVVYAYSPKNEDELELTVGDKIEVIGYEEEGKCWYPHEYERIFTGLLINAITQIWEEQTKSLEFGFDTKTKCAQKLWQTSTSASILFDATCRSL